jgi:nitroreductase
MDLPGLIRGRRSVRRFRDQEVPEELLKQVFEAVRWSPSGGNIQPWEIIVIKDRETKNKLRETMGTSNPASRSVAEAPVLIVLCARLGIPDTYRGHVKTKFGDWWFMFHLGVAAQNLCLAAHGLNLGTVMTGFFDHDRAREILGVPEGYEVVLMIPLGYPARIPPAPPRRPAEDFVHPERFHRDPQKPDPWVGG